jgi:hypothetical protein
MEFDRDEVVAVICSERHVTGGKRGKGKGVWPALSIE